MKLTEGILLAAYAVYSIIWIYIWVIRFSFIQINPMLNGSTLYYVLMSLFAGIGTFPIYRIAEEKLGSLAALCISLSYLLYFPLAGADWSGTDIAFPTLLLLAYYFYQRKRSSYSAIAYVLGSVLGPLPSLFSFIIISSTFASSRRKVYYIPLAVSSISLSAYAVLRQFPSITLNSGLFYAGFFALFIILLPLLFAPLTSYWALALIPLAVLAFASSGYQYPQIIISGAITPFIPFIFLGLIEGSHYITRENKKVLKVLLIILLINITSFAAVYQPVSPLNSYSSVNFGMSNIFIIKKAGIPNIFIIKKAGIQHYYALVIKNSQSSATPNPFQQMINISSFASFWSYINTTSGYIGSNVVFFWSNGTVIPSWMENYYSSHTSPYILWWVKLAAGIPASSSITIYVGIGSMSTNYYSTYLNTVGEAPQLSPTYAEYDSGANVFNNYWNFAGTSLPSGWTEQVATGSITINNGVTIHGGTGENFNTVGIYLNTTYLPSLPYIVDFSQQMPTSPAGASFTSNWYGFTNTTTNYATAPNAKYFLATFAVGVNAGMGSTFGGSTVSGTLSAPSDYIFNGVFTLYMSSTSLFGYYNYSQSFGHITGASYNQAGMYLLIAQMGQEGNYVPSQQIYWLRARAYPPNGVLPSITIYQITSVSGFIRQLGG